LIFGIRGPAAVTLPSPPMGATLAVLFPACAPLLLRDHGDHGRSGGDDAGKDGENDLTVTRIHPPSRRNRRSKDEQAHEHDEQEMA